MGTHVRSFWAKGYEGVIFHEYHEDAHSMYFHHTCKHVKCGKALDPALVDKRELIFCYHCGEKLINKRESNLTFLKRIRSCLSNKL